MISLQISGKKQTGKDNGMSLSRSVFFFSFLEKIRTNPPSSHDAIDT